MKSKKGAVVRISEPINRDNDEVNTEQNRNILYEKQFLIEKMNFFCRLKPQCRSEIELLVKEFNSDNNLIITKLKKDAGDKFDDYIKHPKTKLKINGDEVNNVLKSLENEVKEIITENMKDIEIKMDNLKAKIVVLVNKINKYLFDTKAQFDNVYLSGTIEGDKELKIDDLVESFALGFGIGGGGIGALVGIGITQGVAEGIGGGLLLGGAFGIASAGVGLLVGLVGYGIYNIYKATHKEEDLVELVQKSKKKFYGNIDNYCNQIQTQLNEYKEGVIKEFEKHIETQVSKFKLRLDKINAPEKYENKFNNYKVKRNKI